MNSLGISRKSRIGFNSPVVVKKPELVHSSTGEQNMNRVMSLDRINPF